MTIDQVTETRLAALLPLMRAYCDFYRVAPPDAALLAMARALIADPDKEGVQLIALEAGEAIGFATIFWSWETSGAARIGVMNDLFVTPEWRGRSVAEALIQACRDRVRQRGANRLTWQTAPDNLRAQRLYERVGAIRETWIDYWLPVEG